MKRQFTKEKTTMARNTKYSPSVVIMNKQIKTTGSHSIRIVWVKSLNLTISN